MTRFLLDWEGEVIATGTSLDQPALRRALYHTDLRFSPLPMEYNLKQLDFIDHWRAPWGAPRVLHDSGLHHKPAGAPETPIELSEILLPYQITHLQALTDTDWSPGGNARPLTPPFKKMRRQFLNPGAQRQNVRAKPKQRQRIGNWGQGLKRQLSVLFG
jgi:hypothetical protein